MLSLDHFSDVVGHIYGGAVNPAQWPRILGRLMHATGTVAGSLLTSDFRQRQLKAVHVGFDPAAQISYNRYYGGIDPLAPVLERSLPGSVVLSHNIVPPWEEDKTEFYSDWVHPAGIGLTAFSTLLRNDGVVSILCLGGPLRARKKIDGDEISKLLMYVIPHLRQALQVSLATQSQEIERRGILAALHQIRHGVIILDERLKILLVNDAATRITTRGDGLAIMRGHLCATRRCENSALQRLIGLAIGRDQIGVRSGGTIAVMRTQHLTPLAVHVTPLREADASGISRRCVVVCIVDPTREPQLWSTHLQQLYGLTRAETAVAVRILRGHKLQAVADELDVTLSTVRIHLQRVFGKTHTHRQAQLVRLLLEASNVFETMCPQRRE
jgi:DNA-binding CsgD family transcriptional regulator